MSSFRTFIWHQYLARVTIDRVQWNLSNKPWYATDKRALISREIRATLNAEKTLGCLNQYMVPNSKYIEGECPHLINIWECPTPHQQMEESVPILKMCYEASMNKTNSPLTSCNNWGHPSPPPLIWGIAHTTDQSPPLQERSSSFFILVISLSSFKKIGTKLRQLMCGQAPAITGPHIH